MSTPSLQDCIHEWQADEGQTDATMLTGQLEVIAEHIAEANKQAETANLIALLDHLPNTVGRETLHQIILDRLGLS